MLRHAYYKAYFPVDSGTPPLGLSLGGLTFVEENTPMNGKVASSRAIFWRKRRCNGKNPKAR